MDKNQLRKLIRTTVVNRFKKTAANKYQEYKILNEVPELIPILGDLMSADFSKFVKDIDYVAPKPPTFRVVLENDQYFYLSDLNARALIMQANMDSPAIEVAQKRGIPVILLSPVVEEEAGIFTLEGDENPLPDNADFARPEDIALVLHTSGTTSRPKIVPLAHSNICTSAQNIRTTLKLKPEDFFQSCRYIS